MTKEEMEKKRDEHAKEWNSDRSQCFESFAFKCGWNACAEEYEKEIERLKSWEEFNKNIYIVKLFQSFGDQEKETINLMIDGMKYRQQNKE